MLASCAYVEGVAGATRTANPLVFRPNLQFLVMFSAKSATTKSRRSKVAVEGPMEGAEN